jgi:hypothetical protein
MYRLVKKSQRGKTMIDLYRWLWSRIGGRPWTYILRDVYHEAEWLIQTIWYLIGMLVGMAVGWQVALIIWLIYTFGYINGHLFWGTRWIKGQKGD